MPIDSKTITIIALFASIAIVLNLSPLKIPAPFANYLIFQVWEIPIVIAFLLYGLKVGVTISIVNTVILFFVFPGALPTGPIYNLIAVLSTLLGIYIVKKFFNTHFNIGKETILTTFSTVIAIIFRVIIMSLVNWVVLRYPPPLGYAIEPNALPPFIVATALFNGIIVLYTIPIAYIIARAVTLRTKNTIWN